MSPYKKRIIENDEEYITQYFKICKLFDKKRALIDFYEEGGKKVAEKENSESEGKREKEIAAINNVIKKEEGLFWDKVDKSIKDGKQFVVEKLAENYLLELFEKRAVLFLLYLEICSMPKNMCLQKELVIILSCEDSAINRMKNLKYFADTSALIKNGILIKEIRRIFSNVAEGCFLSGEVVILLSSMLSGAGIRKGLVLGKTAVPSAEVGYEKMPQYSLEDVKLKADIKDRVTFLLSSYSENSLEKFGVQRMLKSGNGLVLLFYGPPGTGKSMFAEAVASYLNKKILMVDFSKITSRWYGNTDKNIVKIFESAKMNNLVICMDEADSLLYNRVYAAQEHDIRIVNVMLQEIERYKQELILTTNMDILLDPALERRVTLKVKFELPDEDIRAQIWQSHIPDKVIVGPDVDFHALAKQFKLSGGYIRNAVFHALRRLSVEKRNILTMEDLLFGARLETEGLFTQDDKPQIGFFAHA